MNSETTQRFKLRCLKCKQTFPALKDRYLCSTCQSNLEVVYDYEQIKTVWDRDQLKACQDFTMWRYLSLYPVTTKIESPPVGWTPLFSAPRLAQRCNCRSLFIKDDSRNPSASFKDRASAIALVHAKEQGFDLVTGASTGNAASSTAVLAAALDMRARIFVPHTAPEAKIAQLLAFGADLWAVDGTYDEAFDLCLAATKKYGWYNRNTGYNPYTREGKKSVSFEICEQLNWQTPDLVAVPVGDGNILSGVAKGFVEFHRLGWIDKIPRLLAVQAEHSDAIVSAWERDNKEIIPVTGETVADSISVSLPRDGLAAVQSIQLSNGLGIRVSDDEILAAILEIARNEGVFGEPAGVTAYAGLKKALQQGLVDPNWRSVILVTGNGLKDIKSVRRVVGKPQSISPNPKQLSKYFNNA